MTLIQDPELVSYGYQYHSKFQIMLCVECEYAVLPENIHVHPTTAHHNIISNPETMAITLAKFPLASPKQVLANRPPAGLSSIEGLKIQDGYQCSQCDYAGGSHRTINNHFPKSHPDITLSTAERIISVKVQQFFAGNFNSYFAVNPILNNLASNSLLAVFMQNNPIPPEPFRALTQEPRTLHPLTKMAHWNVHLESYMDSVKAIKTLVDLTTCPAKDEAVLCNLKDVVTAYLQDGFTKADKTHWDLKRILHHYPK